LYAGLKYSISSISKTFRYEEGALNGRMVYGVRSVFDSAKVCIVPFT